MILAKHPRFAIDTGGHRSVLAWRAHRGVGSAAQTRGKSALPKSRNSLYSQYMTLSRARQEDGIFIVIDGTDGSGKATQTKLLVKHLKKFGWRVSVADFPQYRAKSAGPVEEYLNGKYGTAKEVGPYRASMFFAVDRYAASFKIRRWLEEGRVVIGNRYVSANLGHQGSHLPSAAARRKFFSWAEHLEYNLFGIPRPDLVLVTHVPAHLAQKLVDLKGARSYIKKKRDLLEADLAHLKRAEATYLQMARELKGYRLIECLDHGRLLSPKEVHQKIWQAVQALLRR